MLIAWVLYTVGALGTALYLDGTEPLERPRDNVARIGWMLAWPVYLCWLAQDWLRRCINRWWYCPVGEHWRIRAGVPCQDCGRR